VSGATQFNPVSKRVLQAGSLLIFLQPGWQDIFRDKKSFNIAIPKSQSERYGKAARPNHRSHSKRGLSRIDRNFQKAGVGDWPQNVVSWCSTYFNVTLRRRS
jgi:hypothetical protein